jgi:1-deoxy-D-xylulose-5-phosphate reductoisomerase
MVADGGYMDNASHRETITILGATGSIGLSTLDLLARRPDRFAIDALTANRNAAGLATLAIRHKAKLAVVADPEAYGELKAALSGTGIAVAAGADAVVEAASRPVSRVMAAIVGAAGLMPTMAAVQRGATVMLANKECLVCAGALFMDAARDAGATILPVDSEHSAVFQALEPKRRDSVEKVILTASGGPFREWTIERIAQARPEEAVRHPNWSMGAKISIDSATLMNKGLELIEARYLFGLLPDKLDVLVHPESIVHGMVAYVDGSIIAQMAPPDMRTPIAYCLAWPERIATPTDRLDLATLGRLTFDEPDLSRFPALAVARSALEDGGVAPTVLNAANEIAVAAYLENRITFPDIVRIVQEVLDGWTMPGGREPRSLEEALMLDSVARQRAHALIPGPAAHAV